MKRLNEIRHGPFSRRHGDFSINYDTRKELSVAEEKA
jgi:hypothetical protein